MFTTTVAAKPSGGLPVEIWTVILEMALEDPTLFSNFPQFLLDWKLNRLNENADWKKFRLVSRTWYNILDKIERWSTAPHLETRNYAQMVKSSGIRSLRVYDYGDWGNANPTPYPFDLELLLSARSITAISVRMTYLMRGFNEFLLENPDYFPNVRSLSFGFVANPDPSFWSALEKGFPRLVSLRVEGRLQPGTSSIFLPKLKILEMELPSPPLCQLPSLEHLSILVQPDHKYKRFILRHGGHLKSLHVPRDWPDGPEFIQANWTNLPNLKYLGGMKSLFARVEIPRDHPLEHIFFVDPSADSQLTIPQIITRFPKLRNVTFDYPSLPWLTMRSVRTACWWNKVKLTDIAYCKRNGSCHHGHQVHLQATLLGSIEIYFQGGILEKIVWGCGAVVVIGIYVVSAISSALFGTQRMGIPFCGDVI
jgi:hypothetical protein